MEADLSPYRIETGLWEQIISAPLAPGDGENKISGLFLDRDGILNVDTGYVGDVKTLKVQTQIAPLIRYANHHNRPVIIVTNQSGIGREYYGWAEFNAVNDQIRSVLKKQDARIDAIYACAYHPQAVGGYAVEAHDWRKPNPGMVLAATKKFNIDLTSSILIGDRSSDIEAARAAGLSRAILIPNNSQAPKVLKIESDFQYLSIGLNTLDWNSPQIDFLNDLV